MNKNFHTSKGELITTESSPFKSGGEGEIYRITSPASQAGNCIKIYYAKERNKEKEQKLLYMKENTPHNLGGLSENYIICWPEEVIYEAGKFVGFLMPLAFSESIVVYELCNMRIRKNLILNSSNSANWENKFTRTKKEGIQNRLKLCANISNAFYQIHSLNKYVLVDIKPQNILITIEGKVSIIDIDSTQITNGNLKIFSAKVATPDYTPPEGYYLNLSTDKIPETWDRFSIGVLYYLILLGIHPFSATFKGAYENSNTIAESIKHNLFVHGVNSQYVSVMPQSHLNFAFLPTEIRDLFSKTFEYTNNQKFNRPSAEDWSKTLYSLVVNNNSAINPFTHVLPEREKQVTKTPLGSKGVATGKSPSSVNANQNAASKEVQEIFWVEIVLPGAAFFIGYQIFKGYPLKGGLATIAGWIVYIFFRGIFRLVKKLNT